MTILIWLWVLKFSTSMMLGTMPNRYTNLVIIDLAVSCCSPINPRRACAARVTFCHSVCLSVCPREFSHYRLQGGQ